MKFWKILALLLCAGAIGLGAWRLAFPPTRHKSAEAGPTPVTVRKMEPASFPIIYTLLGTVVPITNVTITPRVSGHILNVYYQEGQHVKKGEELELIDPRPYAAAVAQARGTLAADRAQLEKARVDNRRYQKLLKQNSTSAMLARDQEFQVQQLEGQVAYDEGVLQTAELNLYYCHILAPVAGRVGIRALDKGNYVTAGQSGGLTTLTQMQPISVIFTLPQKDLGLVAENLALQKELPIEAWDGDNEQKLATGTVQALDSHIDTATGTVRLRGIFPNEDERLFPNEFVNIHLKVKTLNNALILPSGAIQNGPDTSFVYLLENQPAKKGAPAHNEPGGNRKTSGEKRRKDSAARAIPSGTAKITPIVTGPSDHGFTVVKKGLHAGDQVIIEGLNHLRPNAPVMVVKDTLMPEAPQTVLQ